MVESEKIHWFMSMIYLVKILFIITFVLELNIIQMHLFLNVLKNDCISYMMNYILFNIFS